MTQGALESINQVMSLLDGAVDKGICDQMRLIGLNPSTDFMSGDWSNCNFEAQDLRACDFRNARLYKANFSSANVAGADFRGASDLHTAKLHFAKRWRDAILDEGQLVLVEVAFEQRRLTQEQESVKVAKAKLQSFAPQQWVGLIKHAANFDEAHELVKQMDKTENAMNVIAYTATMMKANSRNERKAARELFTHFMNESGQPDMKIYTAAIGVAKDTVQAEYVFREMKGEANIAPDHYTYNKLISRMTDFSKAMSYFREMKSYNLNINEYTGYALLDACESIHHAITTMIEMKKAGVDIFTTEFLTEFVNKTRNHLNSTAKSFDMLLLGHSISDIFVTLIIENTQDPWRTLALDSLGLAPPQSSAPH
jgi:hypothetical protein